MIRGGTVPVPPWRGVDGVAGPDLDHRTASGLDESPAFGDVQRLPVGVTMPRRVRAGGEPHGADPQPRGRDAGCDHVEPDVTGEGLGWPLGGRLLRLDLHVPPRVSG